MGTPQTGSLEFCGSCLFKIRGVISGGEKQSSKTLRSTKVNSWALETLGTCVAAVDTGETPAPAQYKGKYSGNWMSRAKDYGARGFGWLVCFFSLGVFCFLEIGSSV